MCTSLEVSPTFLGPITWILGTAWEVVALCFAIWIAVKHFKELQRSSTGWTVGDCFMVLMKTHVFYFASWGHILNMVDFFTNIPFMVVLLWLRASTLARYLQRSMYVHLWLHLINSHHSLACSSHFLWELPFILAFLDLHWVCRCLCWDHASSLASENIMQISLPTLMQGLTWIQLFSRSAWTFQLAV